MDTMIIGIAGGTGSGKTTLTQHLKDHFGENVSVVYHDNYYKAHPNMPYEERCKLNYAHPDAFDTDLMVEDLKTLCAGQTIHCPVYDYTIHNRSKDTVEVRPTKVVIVEGILIFHLKERGRSLDSVISQYLNTVKPMHQQFVQPSRQYADIVVLDGGHNLVALDMITQRIKSHVDGG